MKTTITLVRTAPEFPPGSMVAYANLVAAAISGAVDLKVQCCDFFDPSGGDSMRQHHLWRLRHARSFFAQHPSDLYHLLDGSMAGLLPSNVLKRTVVTVHDLIPLLQIKGRLSGCPSLVGRFLIHRAVRNLKGVAGVASVSEHTARDILMFTGRSDVTVIPHPVRGLPTADEIQDLPDRYLFHIGNNADYKNRNGVVDVFAKLQDIQDLHLIMAGPAPTPQLLRKAQSLDRVEFRADVKDSELSSLYKHAALFLFPSLYEGFGMPVLEAMGAGCPVVCSDGGSLPEVAGRAARVVKVGDVDELAHQCREVLTDARLRGKLIQDGKTHAAKFTMQRFSDSLLDWYGQTIGDGWMPKE